MLKHNYQVGVGAKIIFDSKNFPGMIDGYKFSAKVLEVNGDNLYVKTISGKCVSVSLLYVKLTEKGLYAAETIETEVEDKADDVNEAALLLSLKQKYHTKYI